MYTVEGWRAKYHNNLLERICENFTEKSSHSFYFEEFFAYFNCAPKVQLESCATNLLKTKIPLQEGD